MTGPKAEQLRQENVTTARKPTARQVIVSPAQVANTLDHSVKQEEHQVLQRQPGLTISPDLRAHAQRLLPATRPEAEALLHPVATAHRHEVLLPVQLSAAQAAQAVEAVAQEVEAAVLHRAARAEAEDKRKG